MQTKGKKECPRCGVETSVTIDGNRLNGECDSCGKTIREHVIDDDV